MKKLILILSLFLTTCFVSAQFGSKNIISNDPGGPTHVQAADLDNDGDMDLVTSLFYGDKIVWNENLGGGVFGNSTLITFRVDGVRGIYVVDLDNDGFLDVLAASNIDFKISWYKNLGTGVIDTTQRIINNFAAGPRKVYSADLDNDGDMDVLSAEANGNMIAWYENQGLGVFGAQQIITTNAFNAYSVYAVDMDNDGDIDVLSASYGDDKIAWYENQGLGVFGAQQVITTNADFAQTVYAADLDNDGDEDVLSASANDNKIAWYENLGGGIVDTIQHVLSNTVYSTGFVRTGDIDGDGDIDVVATGQNKIVWFENFGGGSFSSEKIISTNVGLTYSTTVADADSDGDLDVFSCSDLNNEVVWFENYFIGQKLKGNVFYDANQNKQFDTTEFGMQTIKTQLQSSSLSSYSNFKGEYFFGVDTGTYTVNYILNPLWNLTTDSTSFTRTISSLIPLADSLNFGFYPDTLLTIVKPNLTGGFPRCNTIVNYWVNIQNQGTTIPDGIIHLQLDDSITYVVADITPDSINGQNIYWHYDSLFFSDIVMINLQVLLPPFTSIGDTLTSYLVVHELDTFNNIVYTNNDTLDQILLCAYDPNDKSVTPIGTDSVGFISQTQELEYLIRFQNTGNDTAITVMIRDELDENLDWSTLQPISSSDPVQIWIEQDGEAVFKFENIMLPDSGADFLGSQGFVKFSILPDTGLAPLTPIYNTGHIYFDNNPAVITNTVLNTIECYSAPLPNVTYSFPYLDAGVVGNYTYQWFLNDTLIAGATNDSLMPLVDGDYTVEITDSNGCFKISIPYTYIGIITELNSLQQLHTVVFPNPFKESTTILFDKNLNSEYDLLVYNIVGAEVFRLNKIANNRVEINKKDIGKGMFLTYLINNQTGEKIFIEKLIVQ